MHTAANDSYTSFRIPPQWRSGKMRRCGSAVLCILFLSRGFRVRIRESGQRKILPPIESRTAVHVRRRDRT